MALKEVGEILLKIRKDAGEEGLNLAHALIRGYAGIGRGVNGAGCIVYLADQTLTGLLTIEGSSDNAYWVYHDSEKVRRIGGGSGDIVLPSLAKMAVIFHNRAGNAALDEYQILERLRMTPSRVLNEINSRKLVESTTILFETR